jgi:hypothetical protein
MKSSITLGGFIGGFRILERFRSCWGGERMEEEKRDERPSNPSVLVQYSRDIRIFILGPILSIDNSTSFGEILIHIVIHILSFYSSQLKHLT